MDCRSRNQLEKQIQIDELLESGYPVRVATQCRQCSRSLNLLLTANEIQLPRPTPLQHGHGQFQYATLLLHYK
jgi:hypothetical protein